MTEKVDRSVSQDLWPVLMVDVVQPKYAESKKAKKEVCSEGDAAYFSQCVEQ